MTLPDEVLKEINLYAFETPLIDRQFTRNMLERLCLLTRRLTIEECAKMCEEMFSDCMVRRDNAGDDLEEWEAQDCYAFNSSWLAKTIRQLEGK